MTVHYFQLWADETREDETTNSRTYPQQEYPQQEYPQNLFQSPNCPEVIMSMLLEKDLPSCPCAIALIDEVWLYKVASHLQVDNGRRCRARNFTWKMCT